ncbi:MAG TPA: fibronectin type III domain-containing protein, partial [Phycisphaerae bacterium]|nr:fibronectin type III domain-containing protein [Phycisphaerae bacterium]
KTFDGTGPGPFSSRVTGLSPGMTYYVRAYATNSAGTGYGKVVTFTTPADPGEPEPPNDPQDPDSDPPTDPQDPDPDLQERDPDPQDSDPDPPSPDDHATHPISDPQDEDDTQPPTCGWNTLFPWMLTFTGLGLMRSRWRR